MIRIGILGDIGSGKSFAAKKFGYPVFDADYEVSKLYNKDREIFSKLNKKLPEHVISFPIKKSEIIKAIFAKKANLNKIINIVHRGVKKKMNAFLKKNKEKKAVILDVPLLLENKLNKKKDVLIFIDSRKLDINKRLKKRRNFNKKLFNKFRKIQLPLQYKKKKSNFIIKNDFKINSLKNNINNILKKVI